MLARTREDPISTHPSDIWQELISLLRIHFFSDKEMIMNKGSLHCRICNNDTQLQIFQDLSSVTGEAESPEAH